MPRLRECLRLRSGESGHLGNVGARDKSTLAGAGHQQYPRRRIGGHFGSGRNSSSSVAAFSALSALGRLTVSR
jgi:hypothetical protein